MPFLAEKCEKCGKTLSLAKTFEINGVPVQLYKCGHFKYQTANAVDAEIATKKSESIEAKLERFESSDGKKLFPFQIRGAAFAAKLRRSCIFDEMGLGKTNQALAALAVDPKKLPALWITKASLTTQAQRETVRWIGEDYFPQRILTSKSRMNPGYVCYITTYDVIRRIPDFMDQVEGCGIQTIVLDEAQQIKNEESTRAAMVRTICAKVKNVIALSGTPIKNRASEFFTLLNIMRPDYFPSKRAFENQWLNGYNDGFQFKENGISNSEEFQKILSNFVIRRERSEVMPELPAITRNFEFHDLSEAVSAAYAKLLDEFSEEYDEKGMNGENVLAYMSKMRHLTGLSKINPTVEFVEQFLEETDRKLTIFVHHKDVCELLAQKISKMCELLKLSAPLVLTSDLNSERRSNIVDAFKNQKSARILIASTLASGEGLNLQFCSDCIMVERQWNPANEEQAEGRFIRIGQLANAIFATYMVAIGTIDEFFATLVEQKREVVKHTISGVATDWSETTIMQELAEKLSASNRRKWSIKK
jgi:SNF2 family DNA or RNA helicase